MLKQLVATGRTRNIVLAAGAAGLAGLLTLTYVSNYKQRVQEGESTVPVLVATATIPAGASGLEAVANQLVSRRDVAKDVLVSGALSRPRQLRDLIASDTIYRGEQLTARRFRPLAERGVSGELKGVMRAFQVPGDRNQLLAGTLRTGDRVDVVSSIKYKVRDASGTDVDRVATRIVLRDLLVLSGPRSSTGGSSSSTDALAVQLAVSDNQAQKLFFVMKNGEWTLQLRPATRATDSPASVETVESVLGTGLRPKQLIRLSGGGPIR